MTGQEDRLARTRQALAPLRKAAIQEGLAACLGRLGSKASPAKHDLAAARDAAEAALKQRLFSPEWLSAMNGGEPVSKEGLAGLRLSLGLAITPLAVPPPPDAYEVAPLGLAVAAVIGAVGGMMAVAPLTRTLLDMGQTGLFVGAPVGAFVLVLAACRAANSRWLRWLPLLKRRGRYDRGGYEKTVRSAIEQWLDGVVVASTLLLRSAGAPGVTAPDREAMLYSLVSRIRALASVPSEHLPFAVQELVQELRNLGFAGEGEKTFRWQTILRETFDTFGHVEAGDLVVVERDPVFFEGSVRDKGLVRKARDRG
jgi:hypothetical protein